MVMDHGSSTIWISKMFTLVYPDSKIVNSTSAKSRIPVLDKVFRKKLTMSLLATLKNLGAFRKIEQLVSKLMEKTKVNKN